jgi:hypothetical protein
MPSGAVIKPTHKAKMKIRETCYRPFAKLSPESASI